MRLSVLIAVRNEEGLLRPTIDEIAGALTEASIPHEILVVDDHSTDGTPVVLEWLSSKYPSLRVVPNSRGQGFGNAVRTGLDEFTGDAVCIVPIGSSRDAHDIVEYYRNVSAGSDCAFGSRFMSGAAVVGVPRYKVILSRFVNLLIRFPFGLSYDDIFDTFKCYRRSVIDGLRPILSQYRDVALELPLKAILRGCSYAVSPVAWYGRMPARSSIVRNRPGRSALLLVYLLLEGLLTRGEPRAARAAEVERRPSMLMPWLAFACVVLVHLFFIMTYPLNYVGGDSPAYYSLLTSRLSNLCLAPGYPFLAGLPLSIRPIAGLVSRHGAAFRSTLLVAQHAFDLMCLGVFMTVLARVYNRLTAVITVAVAGLSLQGMAVTSSVYPEWMEADFLILTISFALLAWRSETFHRKALWYTFAFGAFTWSYLVKFNAAIFFPLLLLAVVCEALPFKRRAQILAMAGGFALMNYAAFVGLYHRPKTGTVDLSYDHSWVLMARLNVAYQGKLPYPEGMATKRWLALSGVLPPNYGVASVGPFISLDSPLVPKGERTPYRRIAAEILSTNDTAVLDRIIRAHPLPPTFNVGVSSIPISWYVGLKESDDLGVKVFRESVVHHPGEYLLSTAWNLRTAVRETVVHPLFATTENTPRFCAKVIAVGSYLRLVQTSAGPYGYGDALIWKPGFLVFSELFNISAASHRVLVDLILLGFLAAVAFGMLSGWTRRAVIPLLLTAMLGGFVIFSCAVLEFRWKEMRFILPVVALLIGIFGGWTLRELVRTLWWLFFRFRRSPVSPSEAWPP